MPARDDKSVVARSSQLTTSQAIDYAGVRRTIIHRNPPLIDDEGYEVNSEDDDEQVEEAEATAAELNPYANVRLERECTFASSIGPWTDLTTGRHFGATDRFDRPTYPLDTFEAFRLADPHRPGPTEQRNGTQGK